MPRPLKKPEYSKQKITQELLNQMADAFGEPYDDRNCMSEHKPSLREIAEQFDISPIRMRKLLISAGVYSTEMSREIAKYIADGLSIDAIQHKMHLSRASVHSYIPYSKTVYKLPERSTNADRTVLYRKRNNMVNVFQEKLGHMNLADCVDQCHLVKPVSANFTEVSNFSNLYSYFTQNLKNITFPIIPDS